MVHNGILCITGVTHRVHGEITYKANRRTHRVTKRTALRDFKDLCDRNIFGKQDKRGKATEYVLVKKNPDNPDISLQLSYSPIF